MQHPNPVRSVIFDVDGLLLDTEIVYTRVTQKIVSRFGKTFDWSIKANMIGRAEAESARYLVQALDLPITPDEYLAERYRAVGQYGHWSHRGPDHVRNPHTLVIGQPRSRIRQGAGHHQVVKRARPRFIDPHRESPRRLMGRRLGSQIGRQRDQCSRYGPEQQSQPGPGVR